MLRHLDIIESITGHRPPTCPWRAFYHPLVREVLEVVWSMGEGNLGAVIGDDPPWILLQALGVWERARAATRAADLEIKRKEAQQRAKR